MIFLFSRKIDTHCVMPGWRLPWASFSYITREKQTFHLLSDFFQLMRTVSSEIRSHDKHLIVPTRLTIVPSTLFWARHRCCKVLHNPHRSIRSEFTDLMSETHKTTGEKIPYIALTHVREKMLVSHNGTASWHFTFFKGDIVDTVKADDTQHYDEDRIITS